MNKTNPLAGLIANYGDSDDSEDEMVYASESVAISRKSIVVPAATQNVTSNIAGIHPAPVPHCPWSACYDESSGFTYYWNQKTNAVTWEAPPEYLLALKIAQQHLHSSGSTEVSAEEWQLYQTALAEKQNLHNKVIAKAAITKAAKKIDKPTPPSKDKKSKNNKKRPASDDEDEKIELITSYHNSDSESNDETVPPTKVQAPAAVKPPAKVQKNQIKKQKTISQTVEYGPSMPPNLIYTVPIGPELLPKTVTEVAPSLKSSEIKVEAVTETNEKEEKNAAGNDEDSQDENSLLKRLKDKAKVLAKLGGELPSELQQMIRDETNSSTASPKSVDETKKNIEVDDLLEEIEKTEFSKAKKVETKLNVSSALNSPQSDGSKTPLLEEVKPLFPSIKNITEDSVQTLFPSAANIEVSSDIKPTSPQSKPTEKKENMYLMDVNEPIGNVSKKKLRISNSVLPERKIDKAETPAYTTKYSQYIEGFSDQRTGLGFKEEERCDSPKNTISYGNGLTFTKGETLNEGNKDESIEDMADLVEAKLKYLNKLQPCVVTPVQEMLIQLQTLATCVRAGALCARYVRDWLRTAGSALARHEADAAPPGWTCTFQRSEGRYRYRREADGLQQWEYPALDNTDMDISTTPPHQPADAKEEIAVPPLPAPDTPPAAPVPQRTLTPPPPKWPEPPPPGCDDLPPIPLDSKKEIGDELMSFYSDIAELEKQSGPNTASNSPEPPECRDKAKDRDSKTSKKKPKVKISSSIGLKHKSVSNLVAKWQQVADEINSD